ncbi:helix-turn-helix domain-containing protein [Sphingomonas sp. CFBP 8760]|uniref:helix-turn-helix domain-containing protein n=1 Tax=Sphingomonas sp. CFBP 8760 TaxID=2775282 RepID=UPI001780E79A|nr:helix-turn-helix transcriptional regulator [Sphingomonas sp. CFBP 8760]MBD8548163.1 helix-turn-helix transcriptional regulator [Sphingomonas sp. CFBP 8760]
MSGLSTLGGRIKAIRRVAGMGQDALAQALGFSTRSLISWEKDVVEPPLGVVRQLCRDHEIDAGWLVFGTDTTPTRYHGPVEWERYDRLLAMIEALRVDVGLRLKPGRCQVLARSLYDEGDDADADTRRRLRHMLLALSQGD